MKTFILLISDITYETATGSNVNIINTEIRNICKDLVSSRAKIKDLINEEYMKFLTKLEDYENEFQNLIKFISHIDLMQNMCYIVKNIIIVNQQYLMVIYPI